MRVLSRAISQRTAESETYVRFSLLSSRQDIPTLYNFARVNGFKADGQAETEAAVAEAERAKVRLLCA